MQSADQAQDTEPEEAPAGNAPRRHAILLVASFGNRRELRLPAEGSLTIGRGAETPGGPMFDDRLLSREHLRITRTSRGYEIEDLGDLGELATLETSLAEILALEDVEHLAAAMEPGSTAGVLVWENTWAAPFAVATRKSGGQLIASGRIPTQSLIAAFEADAASTEGA